MKKIISIALLFHYVIPVIGISLSVQYCSEEITSISFGFDNSEKCVCGSKKMKQICCQDKNFSLKLKADQHKAPHVSLNTLKSFDFQPALLSTFAFHYNSAYVTNQGSNAVSVIDFPNLNVIKTVTVVTKPNGIDIKE